MRRLCLGQWLRRNISVKLFECGPLVKEGMPFKDILIFSSGGNLVCAILVEVIISNIIVKLF